MSQKIDGLAVHFRLEKEGASERHLVPKMANELAAVLVDIDGVEVATESGYMWWPTCFPEEEPPGPRPEQAPTPDMFTLVGFVNDAITLALVTNAIRIWWLKKRKQDAKLSSKVTVLLRRRGTTEWSAVENADDPA